MPESTQKKLSRIRPPRVQITYDVEIGDAIQMKELPFVVGILADLSGKPAETLPRLKERKFVEIDRDNFDDVLAAAAPRLAVRVDNKLNGGGEEKLNVELNFRSIEDSDPVNVIKQIEPLRKMFEARQRLMDLLAIPRHTRAFRTGLTHMVINLTVVVLFAVSFGLRRGHLDDGDATIAAVVLSIIGLALLAVSGWLGGKLAYRYGVRVADEATQAEGFIRT